MNPVESASQPGSIEAPEAPLPDRLGLLGMGGAALLVSVLLCASSQLILRGAAASPAGADSENLIALFFNPAILGGLGLYASGTALWIFCLSRLDLSLAFPASAIQLVVVYAGARWFLGEEIPVLRLIGAAVILAGIGLLFLEGRRSRVA